MKIPPTTTINIDEAAYDVASMSDEVKNLVIYFDDWRQREFDATSELLLVRAALKELQNTLLTTIQADQAKAAANDETEAQ